MGEQFPDETVDFRALVDHIDGVGLWIVSDPGEFGYVSSGIEDMWGIAAERIQDDPSLVLDRIHEDDRERARSLMEQPPEEISKESYEGRVVQSDGSMRWVHTRQIPVRDDEGNLIRVVGITTDITEQKEREKELAALNRIIRHDIRNDLSVILGWGELLEDHTDEGGKEYLDKIISSSDHIIELTEIARDYAQTVASDGDMDLHAVSVRSILLQELELRSEFFSDAEFTIVGDIPDVEVVANEMLASVFRNLFNNAVQHNDKDQPVVETSVDGDEETVVVRIADNGPGIPEEMRTTIFEEGEKGLESAGTGIGLHLVKTLVDEYNGSVWVTDNEPSGSVFHIELPRPD
jgi:PAS domain S-box-containing protein